MQLRERELLRLQAETPLLLLLLLVLGLALVTLQALAASHLVTTSVHASHAHRRL